MYLDLFFTPFFPVCYTFRQCAKIAVKQKRHSGGPNKCRVQSAGSRPRVQKAEWRCEKNAPFKGIRQSVGNRLLVCPVACSLMHLTIFLLPTSTIAGPGVQFFMPLDVEVVRGCVGKRRRSRLVAVACHAILSPIRRL